MTEPVWIDERDALTLHDRLLAMHGGAAGMRDANTPNLRGLMKTGAWTLKARAVMPTSSSPNWASMIMGYEPDRPLLEALRKRFADS